ncbi:hypothetical protein LTR66_002947 [Elasticomyces elasticus]|nr:hypothetical protein LTR66_002947 [Elasticomyces elasticus]
MQKNQQPGACFSVGKDGTEFTECESEVQLTGTFCVSGSTTEQSTANRPPPEEPVGSGSDIKCFRLAMKDMVKKEEPTLPSFDALIQQADPVYALRKQIAEDYLSVQSPIINDEMKNRLTKRIAENGDLLAKIAGCTLSTWPVIEKAIEYAGAIVLRREQDEEGWEACRKYVEEEKRGEGERGRAVVRGRKNKKKKRRVAARCLKEEGDEEESTE